TIPRLWLDGVAKDRPTPAYLTEEAKGWREHSWAECATAVDELAHGLLALGVRKGDAFAILGSTRLEWALFDFALALVGGVTAPIYANSSPKDCAHVIEHSEAVGILVEDDAQRAKIDDLDEFVVDDDVLLLYLPLAHNFGRLKHLAGPHVGYTVAFCPDPLRVAEVIPAVRPTVLPSVPRVYEKIHTAVTARFDAET